tara:strand:- start:410 stop:1621 length:1212 start_codon:yes stop_codon:yes gene_type:complete
MSKINFTKKSLTKKFQITVVGGGLTGSLMVYILLKSNIISKNSLCWIKPEKKIIFDNRVSFYNLKNFKTLRRYGLLTKFTKKDLSYITNIEVLNELQKKPLSFHENDGLGVICKNYQIQKEILNNFNGVKIINSKVLDTEINEFERIIYLENREIISSNLILAADGSNSKLRELCNIKYLNVNLNHTALNGHLKINDNFNHIARQAFLKEGPIGLLPVSYKEMYINFVWSVKTEFAEKLKDDQKTINNLVNKLNLLYRKNNLIFSPIIKQTPNHLSKIYKWPLKLVHVPKPIGKRIALIGDSAHTIHPLAGQGFNLSLEDCFEILKILETSYQTGKDFGHPDHLFQYVLNRKKRTRSMTFSTTSIFYTFTQNSKFLKNFLSFGMDELEKRKVKNIFKNIASGH